MDLIKLMHMVAFVLFQKKFIDGIQLLNTEIFVSDKEYFCLNAKSLIKKHSGTSVQLHISYTTGFPHCCVRRTANFYPCSQLKKVLDDRDICTSLLQNFASASAEFMFCSISNARPIHMCTSCVDSYSSVVEGHSKIFMTEESENKTCRDELINLDRLAIIEAGYTYIRDLWIKANCRNCFLQSPNFTVPFQLSNETKEFQRLHSDLDECLEANYNESSNEYNKEVCKICSGKYSEMNTFYANLKKDLNDLLCMDIVDSMNVTQNLWSDDLHCGETLMAVEWPLIACTSLVLLLPVVFYVFALKFTKTKPSAVSYQKRLSERIREKWRSRTGSIASQIRFT